MADQFFTANKKPVSNPIPYQKLADGVTSRAAAASTVQSTREYQRLSEPAKMFINKRFNNISNTQILQKSLIEENPKEWNTGLDRLIGRPKLQEELREYHKATRINYSKIKKELEPHAIVTRVGELQKTGMSLPDASKQALNEAMLAKFSIESMFKAGQSLGLSNSFISSTLKASSSALGLDLLNSINDTMRNLAQIAAAGQERGAANREASEQAEKASEKERKEDSGEAQKPDEEEAKGKKKRSLKDLMPKRTEN